MKNKYKYSVEYVIAREKDFSVTVKAWLCGDDWKWNIYAYIFETHPLFKNKERLQSISFNGGWTLTERITTAPAWGIEYDWQKEYTTIKLGNDYAHIWNDRHYHGPDAGIPYDIEADALDICVILLGGEEC